MNVEAIRRSIRDAVRDHADAEIDFGGTRSQRTRDDGKLVIQVQEARMVTESVIEADYHGERRIVDRDFDVLVDNDGVVYEIRERDVDTGREIERIKLHP